MDHAIPERDWKIFRELHKVALDRFCARALAEVNESIAKDGSNHERYLSVYRMLRERDKDLADAFNDMRRSTAVRQLARIQYHKLLTDEELARFSPEMRASAQSLLEIWAM